MRPEKAIPYKTLIPYQPLAYSIDRAAEAICMSPASVWKFIAEGEIEVFKIGARTLIRHDVLQDFIDKKSAQSCIS